MCMFDPHDQARTLVSVGGATSITLVELSGRELAFRPSRRGVHDAWRDGRRRQPRPGAMNSQGAYSWVMSVITSINAGAFADRASRRAPRSPSASVQRQEGTPKLLA